MARMATAEEARMTPAERDRLVADINRHRLPSPAMLAWEANNLDTRVAACVTVGEHQWRHRFGPLWVCHRCNISQHRTAAQ